jgi:hypothetical protein
LVLVRGRRRLRICRRFRGAAALSGRPAPRRLRLWLTRSGARPGHNPALENIKAALASVGGGFEHVVKLTSYLTNLEANGAEFREVRGSYFPNKAALPASTLLQISRLANPAYLVEVEVIAILPPKA